MAASPKFHRSSGLLLLILLVLSLPSSLSIAVSGSLHERWLVIGESNKLELSPSLQVANSPGTKPGALVLCERVFIKGLPRLRNLEKFAHSLKLNLSYPVPVLRRPSVEVCLHRNASIGIGMCSSGSWKKVEKGLWISVMSPFDHRVLDVRMSGPQPENFELSVAEEFFPYRVVFFLLGVLLLTVAPMLSKSLAFYYSSAMVMGVLLVVLVILFQGMKLLPTGRRGSLALVLYSSLLGFGAFLLKDLPGLLRSLLVEMGIGEEMHYPLACVLLACIILVGAWMGFWVIRKLVLTEDGSINITTSNLVAWSIRGLAGVLILLSTLDPLLAFMALLSSIVLSSIIRRICRPRFWRRLFRNLKNFVASIYIESHVFDLSLFGNSYDEIALKSPGESKSRTPVHKGRTFHSWNSPVQGYGYTPPRQLSESDTYLSSFHNTPERRKLSQAEWRESTKSSTKKALEELYASPDFSSWVADNADRITVNPHSPKSSGRKSRSWLPWLKNS